MRSTVLGAAALGLLVGTASAIDQIVIKGSKFFLKSSGQQFFMKGIAYQRDVGTNTEAVPGATYSDPLADVAGCTRDIPLLQQLQTNTVRVYAVDPTKNHDTCMQKLADAGIYVLLDLSNPSESVIRDNPTWNIDLLKRYTDVVDAFAKYDNILGFLGGNEVSSNNTNTGASAFVKAAVRDTKAHIRAKGYRQLGVGYAANDDADIREYMAAYFNCGNQDEAIDFWGYNVYSWCGENTYEGSGYKDRTAEFSSYSVPVFFAEYGCNTIRPRVFQEISALYGSDMTQVWSGGIMYMYFQETNDFGIVSVGSDNRATQLPEFTSYSAAIARATPTGVQMNAYTPSNTQPAACPSLNANWSALATPLPPVANSAVCDCMVQSLRCVTSQNLNVAAIGPLFGQVCGYDNGAPCTGISKDPKSGKYGAYSMCSPSQQLSFAFNKYANTTGRNFAQACAFGGNATSQTPKSLDATCANFIAQAGPDGTNTVDAPPSPANSEDAAAGFSVPAFDFGFFRLGSYVAFAMLSGMAVVFL